MVELSCDGVYCTHPQLLLEVHYLQLEAVNIYLHISALLMVSWVTNAELKQQTVFNKKTL